MRVRSTQHLVKLGFFALALFLGAAISSPGQRTPNGAAGSEISCVVCHSDVYVRIKDTLHSREGVDCTSCHGGDAKALNVAGAHTNNFRRAFDRKQIVELCASCHSDNVKMKPYGIPTDQHALYLTSVHGKRLMQGDARVAACTDCHGVHRILGPADQNSPVFRENIPRTCGKCHENAEMMKDYNVSSSVVGEYRAGVHGRALLERHNQQSPECTRCHGTHGAAPPGIGDVGKVCGQCHTKTLESFRQGPHAAALQAGKLSDCATCHGNHGVERAGREMWSISCAKCHKSDSPQAGIGKTIQGQFTQAEAEIERARTSIEDARRIPLDVTDYEASLSDASTYLLEARPVSHDVSLENAEDLTRRARSIATEIQGDLRKKMSVFRGRTIVLFLVLFYIAISIGVVVKFRRELEARRAKRGPAVRS